MQPLISALIKRLEQALHTAADASAQAHASATHSENQPDNKYDTLALEAAYLAHGQSNRVAALQDSLQRYRQFHKPTFSEDDAIALGALVCLQPASSDKPLWVFLGPAAGGLQFSYAGKTVQVISPDAPLGKALLGQGVDDDVLLSQPSAATRYRIMTLC